MTFGKLTIMTLFLCCEQFDEGTIFFLPNYPCQKYHHIIKTDSFLAN